MEKSITIVGGILALTTFIIIVLFFLISTPMESMFSSFDDANAAEATDEMNEFFQLLKQRFGWVWQ